MERRGGERERRVSIRAASSTQLQAGSERKEKTLIEEVELRRGRRDGGIDGQWKARLW